MFSMAASIVLPMPGLAVDLHGRAGAGSRGALHKPLPAEDADAVAKVRQAILVTHACAESCTCGRH